MDSPTSNSRSTRSPFVPVKRHQQQREQQREIQDNDDNDYSSSNADMKASTTPRPPVVPLTTSNLCRYTATLSNQQQQQQHARELSNEEASYVNNKKAINIRPPGSPALTSSSSVQAAARSLGHGLPSAASTSRRLEVPSAVKTTTNNNIATSMLSAKRYTRQMAAPPADETVATSNNNNNNGMLSASDLRARARVTSGSATRWKGLVPSEKPAQSIYARPETPSSSMSRARARSITANTTSGGAISSTSSSSVSRPVSICTTPRNVSRPPSRAGGDYPSHASVSRPQSRMDDFPPESIIRTKQSIEDFKASRSHTHTRRGSDTSVGTVVQRKQENVLVCVRVRPPAIPTADRPINPAHLEEAWIASNDERAIGLADGTGHRYRFDALVTGSGNENVYNQAAKDLIHSSMNGFDAVIFAYGQTASGKTFTLSGTPTNPGIIPQAVADIFKYIRAHPTKEFLLRASYLEIYNEQLKDLLAPETAGQVKVRQDERKRFFVSPLREEVVTTEAHVSQLLSRGEENRHTGSTDYNAKSSRSHTVFQIVIESRDIGESAGNDSLDSRSTTPSLARYGKGAQDDRAVVTSCLSLIDLAGSEKATSQADRRVEGAFINKSLLTLEKVIAALTEEKARAHVPYRDSKLTQILQPSLSGEARVAVICTINPSPLAIAESTSTLKFAQRVKKVVLHAERNEVVGEKALIIRYEQTIAEMTAYIAQLEHTQTSMPETPRPDLPGTGTSRLQPGKRNVSNPEVLKAKEDRAKLQAFIVTAGNLDDVREDGPRAITPMRPVTAAQLPLLQEQLLDVQDRVAELEEDNEKKQDEIASLKAQLASKTVEIGVSAGSTDAGLEALRCRNEELERQCREYRTILANEDQVTALRSERRLAAREWTGKIVQLQTDLDRSRILQQQALQHLAEERQKTARLEKALVKAGLDSHVVDNFHGMRPPTIRTPLEGVDLISAESPMLDIHGSYLNLDEILDSPTTTPVRMR